MSKLINFSKISDNDNKINLLDFNRRKICKFFEEIGEKPFRADQVMKWIYHHYCDNFDEMSDIKKNLRKKLEKIAKISAPEIIKEQHSLDGTIKWIIAIDDQCIETVYIPEKNRSTLCISSQIGCALKCKFCSTAQQGFSRNLRVSEIIGQVWRVSKVINTTKTNNNHPITNIVIMGMGEPLLNLTNIVTAIEIMLDNSGFCFSRRRITLSTSGIVPALNKLGNMVNIALAISLHAPNDKIRSKIMPINKKYNIKTILNAAQCYLKKSTSNKRHITIEYVMLDHINDDIEHAHQLAKLLRHIPCKINLIPWNSFSMAPYNCSSSNRINLFFRILTDYGFTTTIRKTRGSDIDAACGQLVGNVINRSKCRSYD